MAKSEFQLPSDGETYTRDIVQRCEDLIICRIWSGLDIPQFRAWLSNFDTPLESYFAARVLDALIYHPDEQTKSLMVQLFQRTLPDHTRHFPTPLGPIQDWVRRLSSISTDPSMRIVPVIRNTDPPSKSGPLVCRLLKRYLGLSDRWMIWPWQVAQFTKKGVRIFLCVDDFLGTGYQFRKFLKSTGIQELANDVCILYAPLVAHETGLARLARKVPQIQVATVERLDNSYCLFSHESTHFMDGVNCADTARDFYIHFLHSRGITSLGRMTLGYSDLSLTLAFGHATPNASLPLLWLPHENLHPLFTR